MILPLAAAAVMKDLMINFLIEFIVHGKFIAKIHVKR